MFASTTKQFPIVAVVQPNLYIKNLDHNYQLQETINLTKALNLSVGLSLVNNIKQINSAYFLTSGFLEQLKIELEQNNCEVVIVNYDLSAIQQRNLERFLNCKVLDRTNLIINIFALRAISNEGKLQAELAMLLYQKSRLVKAWSHLERQRGGGGFIGGPGETQKELDKRMLNQKIESIKKQLQKIKLNRFVQKNKRSKQNFKTGVLVGYTNSGKSTLFNLLTNANVLAKDMLFATLDPTARLLNLNKNLNAVLIDTVGFVSNLPHQLVQSFHSTLDVITDADFIIHVIDASNPNHMQQVDSVKKVLQEINVTEEDYNNKAIEIYNKIDMLNATELQIIYNKTKYTNVALVSALHNTGINNLKNIVTNKLVASNYTKHNLKVNFSNYNLITFIYNNGINISKTQNATSFSFTFYLSNNLNTELNNLLQK